MSNATLQKPISQTPTVPTNIVADDATTAIPALNILNVFSRDTDEDNLNGIQTTADPDNGDTLYVELTNRLTSTLPAVAGTTTNLIDFDLGLLVSAYRFNFEVVGIDPILSNSIGFTLMATFKNSGVTASIIQTPFVDADEDIGATLTMVAGAGINATHAILQLTLPAGNDMSVQTVGTYIKV